MRLTSAASAEPNCRGHTTVGIRVSESDLIPVCVWDGGEAEADDTRCPSISSLERNACWKWRESIESSNQVVVIIPLYATQRGESKVVLDHAVMRERHCTDVGEGKRLSEDWGVS